MYDTSDFRKGLKIEYNGEPYEIVDFQHVKPGKGNAFTRTRIKNLITGNVLDITLKSGEKVGKPDLEEKEMQFMYSEGDSYFFMDQQSYEQIEINKETLGDARLYLLENTVVQILFYKGKVIGIELPTFMDIQVAKTEPGVRGDTVSNTTKPAELTTGAKVQVPLFINEGDVIRIDTRTGEYIERVALKK
jgi:elongation factor P